MCIVCLELIKQKMSLFEAERNLGEMSLDKRTEPKRLSHQKKLLDAIKDFDLKKIDNELDADA